jgi:hypothetical protein
MMAMQARLLLAIVLSLLLVHGVVGQVAFPARSQKPQQTRRQQIAERQNREIDAMIVDHHHTDYRRQAVRSPLHLGGQRGWHSSSSGPFFSFHHPLIQLREHLLAALAPPRGYNVFPLLNLRGTISWVLILPILTPLAQLTNFQCTKCVKEADGVTPRATRVSESKETPTRSLDRQSWHLPRDNAENQPMPRNHLPTSPLIFSPLPLSCPSLSSHSPAPLPLSLSPRQLDILSVPRRARHHGKQSGPGQGQGAQQGIQLRRPQARHSRMVGQPSPSRRTLLEWLCIHADAAG